MKICRVMKRKYGYGWAKNNRTGITATTAPADQCVLAVALDETVGIFSGMRKLSLGRDDRIVEAIEKIDDSRGEDFDLDMIRQIGAVVGVKIIVGGHGR